MLEADDTTLEASGIFEGVCCIDFWAEWCEPCKLVGPAFERVAAEAGEGVRFIKVNADRAPRAMESFGVRGVPTILVIRDGAVVARKTGMASAAQIRSLLSCLRNTHQ